MTTFRRRHLGQLRTALLTIPIAVAGCSLANGTPPEVGVLDTRLTGIGLTEQRLSTTLCVTNPNADEIAFRNVEIALDVSGTLLAAGRSDTAIRLPPLSSTAVPFTVVTTIRNVGPQLLSILRSGSLDYRIHGTVSLTGAFGLALPFSRSGRLDLLAGGLDLVGATTDQAPSRCRPSSPALVPS